MKRKIYNKLLEWKNTGMEKPLMVIGARQTGKTYIIEEFCKENFENYVKINLLDSPNIVELYKRKISSEEKYIKMCAMLNINIDIKNTIIFFDEIQESEELISLLKWYCEDKRPFKIICAGSLLGVKLNRFHSSFPVGKVRMIDLYPMDFEEFLWATNANGEYLAKYIKECYDSNKTMDEELHNLLLDIYRKYLCVGGMPEAVKDLKKANLNIIEYNNQNLRDIIKSYIKDMNKYVKSKIEATKNERVYNSIPTQISNKANKFQYSKIIQGKKAKSRDYESSIDWLTSSRMIYKCCLLNDIQIPPEAFKNENFFKLYASDVGILTSLLNINYNEIYLDNAFIYKGNIVENYVAEQLFANEVNLYYWFPTSSEEIDFIIYNNDGIIPIEVKSSDNTQSKSLKSYVSKYKPKYSIRVSSKNFGFANNIKSVPLYATFLIK